jgi:hypothetical protein
MDGQRVGHVRVSILDQNPDRQLEAVSVARIFTDRASGRDTRRPERFRQVSRQLAVGRGIGVEQPL